MRDTSIFQGIKELKDFRFKDCGAIWMVGKRVDTDLGIFYIHQGTLKKNKRESNKALYERALELTSNFGDKYGYNGM